MIEIKSENYKTPILDFVKEYSQSDPTVFHMPGHRLGKGIPRNFTHDLLSLDITEINGSDNLHQPSGIILEAQKMAAEAFGADQTYFLVNGSTAGIQAMILAACKKGDTLIVGRDCHRSVINALMLAGAEPFYIMPGYDETFGINTVLTPRQVENALDSCPGAVGVLITRPGYYGCCCDIESISDIVHARGKLLLVDEAHGAHLEFSDMLPVSAMDVCADACVQSAHKTLPVVTQGAYLHIKNKQIDREKLGYYLDILQTTSPSYIIMAFLDFARAVMENSGRDLIRSLLTSVNRFKETIGTIDRLKILETIKDGVLDPTRIVINFKEIPASGFEISDYLRKRYNIQVEMADLANIVCIATVSSTSRDFEMLSDALFDISHGFAGAYRYNNTFPMSGGLPERAVGLGEALTAPGERVDLEKAVGRVAKSVLTPYPPGVPVICPGEVITAEIVDHLSSIVKAGGSVVGLGDSFDVLVIK